MYDRYDLYSPAALTALNYARQEARILGHDYVDVGHLLIGLTYACPNSTFVQHLIQHGVDVNVLRSLVGAPAARSTYGSGPTMPAPHPLTERAARVFDHLALGAALACRAPAVEPDHVLDALIRSGAASDLLAPTGVDTTQILDARPVRPRMAATTAALEQVTGRVSTASAAQVQALAEAWASLAAEDKAPDVTVESVHDALATRARDIARDANATIDDVLHVARALEALRSGAAATGTGHTR